MPLTPVRPIQPPAPYFGGKRNLARVIVPMIEATPHDCYAEPFIGMGGVFFRRRRRPSSEIINDRNREVATLFRVLKHHPDTLIAEIGLHLNSRALFEDLKAQPPELLTDVQRAARFVLLQYLSYAGRGGHFTASAHERGRWQGRRAGRMFRAVSRRLERVHIEGLDFRECLARYDRPTTLFYLDPPYRGLERIYGRELFAPADLNDIPGILAGLRGTFIMSLNDTPETRRMVSAFQVMPVAPRLRLGDRGRGAELLISNRPIALPQDQLSRDSRPR